jgi:hypothetical protein
VFGSLSAGCVAASGSFCSGLVLPWLFFLGGGDYGDFVEKSVHLKPSKVTEAFVLLFPSGLFGLVLVSSLLYFTPIF